MATNDASVTKPCWHRPQLHVDLHPLRPLEASLSLQRIQQLHDRLVENIEAPSQFHCHNFGKSNAFGTDSLNGGWLEDEVSDEEDEMYSTFGKGHQEVLIDLGDDLDEKDEGRAGKSAKRNWWELGATKRDVFSMVMGLGVIGSLVQWGF